MSSIVFNPSGAPASPVEGEVYYDSTADKLKVKDASAFREVVSKNSSGEIDGTLSSSAVVPASIGGIEVLLETYTAGDDSNKVFDFSAFTTYTNYRFTFNRLRPASDATNFEILLGTSSSSYETSAYRYIENEAGYNGSSAGTGSASSTATLVKLFSIGNAVNDGGISVNMFVQNPRSSSIQTSCFGNGFTYKDSDHVLAVNFASQLLNSQDNTHLKLQFSSGNIATGTVNLYGLKNG